MSLLIIISLLGIAQLGYMAMGIWSLRMAHRDYPGCDENCSCHISGSDNIQRSRH